MRRVGVSPGNRRDGRHPRSPTRNAAQAATAAAAEAKMRCKLLDERARLLITKRERILMQLRLLAGVNGSEHSLRPSDVAALLQMLKGVTVEVVETVVAWRDSRMREERIFNMFVEKGYAPPEQSVPRRRRGSAYSRKDPWGKPIHPENSGAELPQYIWGGYNVLRKMLNDTDFLASCSALVGCGGMCVFVAVPAVH